MNQQTQNQHKSFFVKDEFLTKEEFYLVENQEFGFLETHPIPDSTKIKTYYKSSNYISHTDSKQGFMDKLYQWVKRFNIRYKISLLPKANHVQKILDYGCGTGDFLKQLNPNSFHVTGIEPHEKALEFAQKKLGTERITDKPLSTVKEKFDIITLWHVLEHIPELQHIINEIKIHLKEDGKIYIAVPNHLSYDAKFYKRFWAAYDVPRHLWHFTPQTIESLFNSFGMKIEKTYPLLFDAYYVSILSEKYKGNRWGWIRALCIASVSNAVGFWNGNYSSIIYKIAKT